MRLWTIQPVEVFDEIQKNGYYACNIEKINNDIFDDYFKRAYDWLILKMKEKVGDPPEGITYPVWAWHTYDGIRKSSDLRAPQGKKGEKMVRLEIEVPDDEVVLSDFDAWHFVLNNDYLSETYSEEEWEAAETYFNSLSKEEQLRVKEESWNNVFDISFVDTDWLVRGKYIQATFWKLDASYIKKVKFFKSR